MKETILFIAGVRDDKNVEMQSIQNEHFAFNVGGSSNLFRYIDNDHFDKELLTLDANPNSSIDILGCTILVNQISDFDTHRTTLTKVNNISQQLKESVKIINHPENIILTTRERVATNLQGIPKLIVPKTVRIAPKSPNDIYTAIKNSALTLPVLIRECGQHGGELTNMISTLDDDSKLYSIALDGRHYYLTEFNDYIENGVYKKYRLAIIDGKPYMRHLIFSDNWMIHSESRVFMENNSGYADNEQKQLDEFHNKLEPLIKDTIDEIYKRIKLEYFGIDCNIKADGTMLIFEVNATMNILDNTAEGENIWQKPIESIKQATIDMIMARVKK